MAMKQRQKIVRKRSKTIIKGRNRGFPTESIAEQHDDKIDRVICAKAGTGKLHVVFESRDDPGLSKNVSDCCYFLHP